MIDKINMAIKIESLDLESKHKLTQVLGIRREYWRQILINPVKHKQPSGNINVNLSISPSLPTKSSTLKKSLPQALLFFLNRSTVAITSSP
ncbi:hypothetical protein OIU77_011397 [Salix suchowensis]|uniref:Uncharacterized protein n=1 Tax=Salix suchowensis TaxID=1278906 RepID=A0ABQ9A139_9ROSI|nr:hypothetical protein OIU77_011397 [Salix suchowensis]